MKTLKSLFFLSSLIYFNPAFSENNNSKIECLKNSEINFDISYIPKNSLLDIENFEKDFKNGIKCFQPASFVNMGYTQSSYNIEDITFNYKNILDFGQQAFFLNGKIPNNSFLYSHYSIPVLLYKSKYLNNDDISDYYLSFEKSYNSNFNEELKVIYHSPYDFKRIMIHAKKEDNGDNIFFYFNSGDGSDITGLKESIENYFLNIIQKHDLPLKLQNNDNLEIMRVYFNGFNNSLNLLEPFIQIFLEHIDYNGIGFKKNLKYQKIDYVFDEENEISPFTFFGEHIVISYTYDKVKNSGLIAFSFVKEKEMIEKLKIGFKK